jgi:hypothetical protein
VHCTEADGGCSQPEEPRQPCRLHESRRRAEVPRRPLDYRWRTATSNESPRPRARRGCCPARGAGWSGARDVHDRRRAENMRAVSVRLRECPISFIDEATDDSIVANGETPPKAADVRPGPASSRATSRRATGRRDCARSQGTRRGDLNLVAALVHAGNAVRSTPRSRSRASSTCSAAISGCAATRWTGPPVRRAPLLRRVAGRRACCRSIDDSYVSLDARR